MENPLKKVPIFSKLDDEELDIIFKNSQKKKYPPKFIVFNEGDMEDGLYVILKGKVKITLIDESGKEIALSIMKDGSFFGEMSLFDDFPRSATVETLDETEFLILKKKFFLKILEDNPLITRSILKEMSIRLREADEKIRNLAYMDVAGRLARVIMDLVKKEGTIIESKNIAVLPMPSRQTLANLVGATRETVSRVLGSFQKRGIITISGKKLIVHNLKDY